MKTVLLTPDISSNSLGHAYCLWLLARANGWSTAVFAPRGGELWAPLQGTPFANNCVGVDEDDPLLLQTISEADLVIAIKPLESSFGRARRLAFAYQKPLLLDIDDPDLEAALSWRRPLRRFLKGIIKYSSVRRNRRLREHALATPTTVSNPELSAIYGGTVVPHVREDPGFGLAHVSDRPSIAFVGTNRPHKGVDVLRAAVAARQDLRFSLVLTDVPPPDARPWETWVGRTSMEDGLRIVAESDIVVIPSKRDRYSEGQLPAKLIDAMMAGRAVVVTQIEPMQWALGDGGIVVKPSSSASLAEALGELTDPRRRQRLGDLARNRALAAFTIEANSKIFEEACERVVRHHSS